MRYIGVADKPAGGGGGGGGGANLTVRRGDYCYIAGGSQFPSHPKTLRDQYLTDMSTLGMGGLRVRMNVDTAANRAISADIIAECHARSMKVIGVALLDSATTPAQAGTRGTQIANLDPQPDMIELGNEPNFGPQWTANEPPVESPNLDTFTTLAQACRDAAVTAGFTGPFMPGGPSPIAASQENGIREPSTPWNVDVMAAIGAGMDAHAYHAYCSPVAPGEAAQTHATHGVRLQEECITDLLAAGYGTKAWPFVTEVAWSLGGNAHIAAATPAQKLAGSAAMLRRYTNETITFIDRRVTPNVTTTHTRKVADLRPVCFYSWSPKYNLDRFDQGCCWIDFRWENNSSNPIIDQSAFRAGMAAVMAETVTFAA